MIGAVKSFFANYVNFKGRSRRRDYWLAMLGLAIVEVILYVILMASIVSAAASETQEPGPMFMVSMILLLVFTLAIIVPSLAIVIRRLHDIGKSGVWFFISFIPVIGSIMIFIFMLMDSQPGTNQWGPNPKGIES